MRTFRAHAQNKVADPGFVCAEGVLRFGADVERIMSRAYREVRFVGRDVFAPRYPVDVRAESAEWYGCVDGIALHRAPTMLDELTRPHEFIYGDLFTEQSCRIFLDIAMTASFARYPVIQEPIHVS